MPIQRQRRREARLDKIRARTNQRNAIKGYLAAEHGVNSRRIVLADKVGKFIGKNFNGRYVIKNRIGLNTKVNF